MPCRRSFFAYHVAVFHGQDVDQPRNLAKSVTVGIGREKQVGPAPPTAQSRKRRASPAREPRSWTPAARAPHFAELRQSSARTEMGECVSLGQCLPRQRGAVPALAQAPVSLSRRRKPPLGVGSNRNRHSLNEGAGALGAGGMRRRLRQGRDRTTCRGKQLPKGYAIAPSSVRAEDWPQLSKWGARPAASMIEASRAGGPRAFSRLRALAARDPTVSRPIPPSRSSPDFAA